VSPTNARLDDNGIRRYTWEGIEYPSATSQRKLVGMSYNLHEWIVSQVIDAAIGLAPMIVSTPDVKANKRLIRQQADTKRDKASDLGTRVHAGVAEGLDPAKAGDLGPFIRQYQNFLASTGFRVLHAEKQVFNLTLGYGGSFDILGRDLNDRTGVVDIKTGTGVYTDHLLQLCSYCFAEFVGENDVVDREATEELMLTSFIASLHLQTGGWEYTEYAITPELVRAFKSMHHLAHLFDVHPTPAGLANYTIKGAA
jgi:hypothetical protein